MPRAYTANGFGRAVARPSAPKAAARQAADLLETAELPRTFALPFVDAPWSLRNAHAQTSDIALMGELICGQMQGAAWVWGPLRRGVQ